MDTRKEDFQFNAMMTDRIVDQAVAYMSATHDLRTLSWRLLSDSDTAISDKAMKQNSKDSLPTFSTSSSSVRRILVREADDSDKESQLNGKSCLISYPILFTGMFLGYVYTHYPRFRVNHNIIFKL